MVFKHDILPSINAINFSNSAGVSALQVLYIRVLSKAFEMSKIMAPDLISLSDSSIIVYVQQQ